MIVSTLNITSSETAMCGHQMVDTVVDTRLKVFIELHVFSGMLISTIYLTFQHNRGLLKRRAKFSFFSQGFIAHLNCPKLQENINYIFFKQQLKKTKTDQIQIDFKINILPDERSPMGKSFSAAIHRIKRLRIQSTPETCLVPWLSNQSCYQINNIIFLFVKANE